MDARTLLVVREYSFVFGQEPSSLSMTVMQQTERKESCEYFLARLDPQTHGIYICIKKYIYIVFFVIKIQHKFISLLGSALNIFEGVLLLPAFTNTNNTGIQFVENQIYVRRDDRVLHVMQMVKREMYSDLQFLESYKIIQIILEFTDPRDVAIV